MFIGAERVGTSARQHHVERERAQLALGGDAQGIVRPSLRAQPCQLPVALLRAGPVRAGLEQRARATHARRGAVARPEWRQRPERGGAVAAGQKRIASEPHGDAIG